MNCTIERKPSPELIGKIIRVNSDIQARALGHDYNNNSRLFQKHCNRIYICFIFIYSLLLYKLLFYLIFICTENFDLISYLIQLYNQVIYERHIFVFLIHTMHCTSRHFQSKMKLSILHFIEKLYLLKLVICFHHIILLMHAHWTKKELVLLHIIRLVAHQQVIRTGVL